MENIKSAKNVVLVAVIGGLVGALACLAVVLMVALPGHSAVAADKTTSDLNAVVASDNLLAGKKVYLDSAFEGIALSDADAQALHAKMVDAGTDYTMFNLEMREGQDVVDPVTGVTYVVGNSMGYVNLMSSEPAKVYVLGENHLANLLNGGSFSGAGMAAQQTLTGEFGSITLYI